MTKPLINRFSVFPAARWANVYPSGRFFLHQTKGEAEAMASKGDVKTVRVRVSLVDQPEKGGKRT